MPRRREYDRASIDDLLRANQGVVKRSDLLTAGVPNPTITRWCGVRGRWQRVLPGVVLGHRGTPTTVERRRAALVYAGEGARISGVHALDLHAALTAPLGRDEEVLVVVPQDRHRTSADFCVVERSERDPGRTVRRGFPVTSAARACADAVRGHDLSADDVRELMSSVLRHERCSLRQLEREVLGGPTQRSGPARAALRELGAGVRSAAEAKALQLVSSSDLVQPLWNRPVVVAGRWLGEADAFWPELGVVLEIDSMLWHLGARALRRTQAKARRYAAAGLTLITIAPADLLADPRGFLETLRSALAVATARRIG
ncbi:hypothetical protein ACFEMC_12850 [Kineococcus sp. DHX-1]|uniref:hypothetical protein n=1 Tax=Kineococcus sp. DHX-1 TaxID=3349638 RepID=UPI0036D2993E